MTECLHANFRFLSGPVEGGRSAHPTCMENVLADVGQEQTEHWTNCILSIGSVMRCIGNSSHPFFVLRRKRCRGG